MSARLVLALLCASLLLAFAFANGEKVDVNLEEVDEVLSDGGDLSHQPTQLGQAVNHLARFIAGRKAATSTAIDFPEPASPGSGWVDTKFQFWMKGFIPGKGCSEKSLKGLDGEHINVSPKCTGNRTPSYKDGVSDSTVLKAPGVPGFPQWFRHDARCWGTSPSDSHRLGAHCKIFKKGGEYKVVCKGAAGWTRHYKREGVLSNGCWFVSCQKKDGYSSAATSTKSGNKYTVKFDIEGGNPCVFGAPNIALNLRYEMEIGNGKVKFTNLKGEKSQFPAWEAVTQDGSSAPKRLFGWGIDDRGLGSLLMPNKNVNWSPSAADGEFTCSGCK